MSAAEVDQSNIASQVMINPDIEFKRIPRIELPPEVLAINQQRINILSTLQGQPDEVFDNEAILFKDIAGRKRFATRGIPQELRDQGVDSISIAYSDIPFAEASDFGITARSEIRLQGSLPNQHVDEAENSYYFSDDLEPRGRQDVPFLVRRFILPSLEYDPKLDDYYQGLTYSDAGILLPDFDTLGMAVSTLYEKASRLLQLPSQKPQDTIASRLVAAHIIYAKKESPLANLFPQ